MTEVKQYAGAESQSNTHQDTTMTYDGHGRLLTRHLPEETSNTYTAWTYKPDDTIATVTDPRNAVTAFYYGNIDDSTSSEYRTLPTKIAYSVPSGSGIADPADVNFTYDSAGNRTYLSDGSGNTTYSYDELSRLKAETKNFTDTLANAPTGGYKLQYNYHLNGSLKSIDDPFGAIVAYNADKIGRTTAVTGSGFFDAFANHEVTSYVSDINYRAFGGVKSMTYTTDDAAQISLDYNTRLQPASYEVTSAANNNDIQNKTYSYYNDGSPKEVIDANDSSFSQYYDYDFAGRIKRNEFGTGSVGENKPYKQTLGYDAFNHINSRSTWTWGTQRSYTATYTNNRKVAGGYQSSVDGFDAAGNVIQSIAYSPTNNQHWKFDAAGRMTEWDETAAYIGSLKDIGGISTFDGDGQTSKLLNRVRDRHNGNMTWYEEPEYFIYSSVTGQKITNLTSTGQKLHTYVYLGGTVIADQWSGTLEFKYNAPVTGSIETTNASGEVIPNGGGRTDTEALGAAIPAQQEELQILNYQKGGHTGNPESGCQINYAPVSCDFQHSYYRSMGGMLLGGAMIDVSVWKYDIWKISGPIPAEAWRMPQHLLKERGQFLGSVYVAYVDFYTSENWSEDPPYSKTPDLRTELGRRLNLNNGECRNKLNDLLKALGKEFKNKKLKLQGFDALAENFLGGKKKLLEKIGGDSNYSSGTGKITMNVDPKRGEGFMTSIELQGFEIIHELLHAASKSGFTHEDIVEKIAEIEGLDFKKLETGEKAADKAAGNTKKY